MPRVKFNEKTPTGVRKWLDFIADSLDGKVEESNYNERLFQRMVEDIRRRTIDPDLLSEIKDEAAWELAKARFAREGREDGMEEGWKEGRKEGMEKGREESARNLLSIGVLTDEQIAQVTGFTLEKLKLLKESE